MYYITSGNNCLPVFSVCKNYQLYQRARNGQEVVGRGRNKLGRGRKGQVEAENDQVGPRSGRKYPPVPTPKVSKVFILESRPCHTASVVIGTK